MGIFCLPGVSRVAGNTLDISFLYFLLSASDLRRIEVQRLSSIISSQRFAITSEAARKQKARTNLQKHTHSHTHTHTTSGKFGLCVRERGLIGFFFFGRTS